MTVVVDVLAGIGAWFLASLTVAAAWAGGRAGWRRHHHKPPEAAASSPSRQAVFPRAATPPPGLPRRHGGPIIRITYHYDRQGRITHATGEQSCGCLEHRSPPPRMELTGRDYCGDYWDAQLRREVSR